MESTCAAEVLPIYNLFDATDEDDDDEDALRTYTSAHTYCTYYIGMDIIFGIYSMELRTRCPIIIVVQYCTVINSF